MVRYFDLRKHSFCFEPLFSFMDGNPITRQYFTQQLQAVLSFSIYRIIIHIVFELGRHPQLRPSVLQNCKYRLWVDGTLTHFGNTSEFQLCKYSSLIYSDLEDRGFRSITNTQVIFKRFPEDRSFWSYLHNFTTTQSGLLLFFSLLFCVMVFGVNKTT